MSNQVTRLMREMKGALPRKSQATPSFWALTITLVRDTSFTMLFAFGGSVQRLLLRCFWEVNVVLSTWGHGKPIFVWNRIYKPNTTGNAWIAWSKGFLWCYCYIQPNSERWNNTQVWKKSLLPTNFSNLTNKLQTLTIVCRFLFCDRKPLIGFLILTARVEFLPKNPPILM